MSATSLLGLGTMFVSRRIETGGETPLPQSAPAAAPIPYTGSL
jgi:hypothetical protein